jgi:phosphoribosyl 1,2-cyclic phosphodiesterase
MFVKFWGTRGSIPTPGPDTVRFGGNTSCVEIRTKGGTLIVLDAGTGMRALGDSLMAEGDIAKRGHILIGHTHWDHIQGYPFFTPLFMPGNEWDVYAPQGFDVSLRDTLGSQMQYNYFPVSLNKLGSSINYHDLVEGTFQIDDVHITAFYLNHTALTLGYRIQADGVTVVYATDHECHSQEAGMPKAGSPLEACCAHLGDRRHKEDIGGADLLIHDAQYTAEEYPKRIGWGHSTLEYVVDIAVVAKVRKLALFHHDPRRDDDSIDAMVRSGQERIKGWGGKVELLAAAEGMTIELKGAAPEVVHEPAPVPYQPIDATALAQVVRSVFSAGESDAFHARLRGVAEADHIQVASANSATQAVSAMSADLPSLVFVGQSLYREEGGELRPFLKDMRQKGFPVIVVRNPAEQPPVDQEEYFTDLLETTFSDEYLRTKMRAWLLRTRVRWACAPFPSNEAQRVQSLRQLHLLDTPPEERFDRITRLAAQIFDVPVSLITMIDSERQWFKSSFGTEITETPRDHSFCAHTILQDGPLVVPDSFQDDRFADNPVATGACRARFYAGQPLTTADGSKIGTLCLIDQRPRALSPMELEVLRDLAALAEFELRRQA